MLPCFLIRLPVSHNVRSTAASSACPRAERNSGSTKRAMFTPNIEEIEQEMSLAVLLMQLEGQRDPMLSTEVEGLLRQQEAREEFVSTLGELPKDSFTSSAISQAVERSHEPNWEAALNSFNRNVAFRANRIFNPARISSYYVSLCSQCLAAGQVKQAMSALAYAGIPPVKYGLVDGAAMWSYDPSYASPEDIVDAAKTGSEISIPVVALARHIVTVMLDIELAPTEEDSRPLEEGAKFGETFGQRTSPHEWLYRQLDNKFTDYLVRDMVLAVIRVAFLAALEWQQLHMEGRYLPIRFVTDPTLAEDPLQCFLPALRSLVNIAGTELGEDPDFTRNQDVIYEAEAVAKYFFREKQRT